jgi:hypothetical protein
MVFHWRRNGGPGARRYMLVNGLGAIATGITVVVVLVAKFVEGAWITLLLIPALLAIMIAVRRHYHRVEMDIGSQSPLVLSGFLPPLVVVPVDRWSKIVMRALNFALNMSPDIMAVHIDSGENTVYLKQRWSSYVDEPLLQLGMPIPKLTVIPSPYRFVLTPIVDYILDLARKNPGRQVAVIIPELVESHWYYHLLHNRRGTALKALLYFKGNEQIIVINVPWYIHAG